MEPMDYAPAEAGLGFGVGDKRRDLGSCGYTAARAGGPPPVTAGVTSRRVSPVADEIAFVVGFTWKLKWPRFDP